MGYDSTTERLISLKKLAGKAQTSNLKGLSNEGLPSGVTISFETVFGESITKEPSDSALYTITGQVEYLRFPVEFIAGTATTDGRHGFELRLPDNYSNDSSNPNAGTYPYQSGQVINITSGALQMVPPAFATDYEAKPYYGGSATIKDDGTQIPLLDARDWYLDYFNGVFFQQDPPGTGADPENPDYVEGYLYIGDYLNISAGSAAGSNTEIQYNDNGSFGASPAFTFTGAEIELRASNPKYTLRRANQDEDSSLSFEGQAGFAGAAITHEALTNDLVFKTFGNGGASLEEILRLAGYYSAYKRQVIFLSGSNMPPETMQPSNTSDIAFFVSGAIGSRNSTTRGVSVFGGDVIVSGSLISLGGGIESLTRSKDTYFLSSQYTPLSIISVPSSDFSSANYSPDLIDINLNGQLLHSGTSIQVGNGERDYYLAGATSLKFSFRLEINDVIDVTVYNIVS